MANSDDNLLTFKPSVAQWDGYLGQMSKGKRSAYVREAILAYIAEHPTITALPLDEPPDEPIRHLGCRFYASPPAVAWLSKIPGQMRSYMIRHMLRWHREHILAKSERQSTFNLESDPLQATGT